VVCSNCTSLPEIAGDAALTFDPTNVGEMASRILAVANDPKCYSQLAEASRRRRPIFSSRASAIKTLAVYQRVYEELYA
jgi:glycosyltransferase involved in cell wall biosynthesis